MAATITKAIGEGFASGQIYAALAYDANDKFGGIEIKSIMTNSTYKHYFRDISQYIYSSAAGTLDIVAATVAITGALTVGVDGTGHDVKFYGDTSGAYMLWDESANELILAGAATLDLTANKVMVDFKAGDASTKTVGSDAPAGWINVNVDGTKYYIPYWSTGA